MKKVYTKPVLVMENFSLSQSIAYGCGNNLVWTQATSRDKYSCGWDAGFGTYFIMGGDICTEDGDKVDGICYNNPEGGFAIFRS